MTIKSIETCQSLPACPITKPQVTADVYSNSFPAKYLFDDECDVFAKKYWLGPNSRANTKVTYDLGCEHTIKGLKLKNTHNAYHHDR